MKLRNRWIAKFNTFFQVTYEIVKIEPREIPSRQNREFDYHSRVIKSTKKVIT